MNRIRVMGEVFAAVAWGVVLGGGAGCTGCRGASTSPAPVPAGAVGTGQTEAEPPLDPEIVAIRDAVSATRITDDITTLVAFGTRNSCSGSVGGKGVEAARDWVRAQLTAVPGVQVRLAPYEQTKCAQAVTRHNVVGWMPGKNAQRLIVVGGHYDSRSTDRIDPAQPAPGANDSGSQTAVVIEAARVMAGHSFDATVMFVAFAGEEQGLVGSAALARGFGDIVPGSHVEAMLNCDIVGGDVSANDAAALQQFRLYSPGIPRELGTAPDGTPDDTSPSRGLMRFIGEWGHRYVPSMTMIPKLREDRVGRGGDHESFIAVGIPGVRFIETNENVAHQHGPDDLLVNMTPAYAARMAQVVATSAAALARAPVGPSALTAARAADGAIRVTWGPSPEGVDHFVIGVRPATENPYRTMIHVAPNATAATFATNDLGLAAGASFYVSVASVDAAGHRSMWAWPESRCDAAGCAVPSGVADVTAAVYK